MQLVHRSILIGAAAFVLLSGCDFSSPWGSSSGGSAYGVPSTSGNSGGGTGTGGTGGGTGPVGGVGGEGSTQGTDDTVMAASSTSLVSVAVGASQTVSVTFNSSDGLAITGFGVSGSLGTLPAGWSGPRTFTCPLVSTGSGCVLNLTYAPTAADSGTLALTYIYVDNAGLSKVPGGSVNIAYQAIAANNVVATASPSGQVNAAVGAGMQSVSVTFTTDSGNATLDEAASNLTVSTDLASLPAGWSSAAPSFACALVTSGNGCQLMLSYAPTVRGSGTLTLDYGYTDDTGASRTGVLQIPYSTTTANTVTGTASPAGQITAAIKGGSQSVAVTFDSDDGKTATKFLVTTALGSLPAGWHSAAGSLQCASVSTGNGCQLMLTYAPTALGSGTLALNYAYDDDTGVAQMGTLDVPYEATTNDNVTATPSPTGQINAVVGNGTQPVTVVFTTDDGRLATDLQITSGLAALPAGWTSGANPFACTTVSSGNGCQLTLTYNPLAGAAGTLTLGYRYKNNANQTKTGSLAIPYRATTDDTIAGAASPSASLAVITGTSTPVSVSFATDDGAPASDLTITSGLSALPAGWTSSATTFSCATVSDGTVCRLPLTYAPTVIGSGTLTLGFSYTNDAGYAKTNTVSLMYRANSEDTVGATVGPAPTITASVSAGIPASVSVTFASSDAAPAVPLSVTSGLTTLPSGWTGPASFTCPTVSNGTICQLNLSYAPTGTGSGSIQLNYQYNNNDGSAATGTATVSYSAQP
jgi:hypothetical protein